MQIQGPRLSRRRPRLSRSLPVPETTWSRVLTTTKGKSFLQGLAFIGVPAGLRKTKLSGKNL